MPTLVKTPNIHVEKEERFLLQEIKKDPCNKSKFNCAHRSYQYIGRGDESIARTRRFKMETTS